MTTDDPGGGSDAPGGEVDAHDNFGSAADPMPTTGVGNEPDGSCGCPPEACGRYCGCPTLCVCDTDNCRCPHHDTPPDNISPDLDPIERPGVVAVDGNTPSPLLSEWRGRWPLGRHHHRHEPGSRGPTRESIAAVLKARLIDTVDSPLQTATEVLLIAIIIRLVIVVLTGGLF